MTRRYLPSPTLLLHLSVVLLGACATNGFTTAAGLAPAPAASEIQARSLAGGCALPSAVQGPGAVHAVLASANRP